MRCIAAHRIAEKLDCFGLFLEKGKYNEDRLFDDCRFFIGPCPWSPLPDHLKNGVGASIEERLAAARAVAVESLQATSHISQTKVHDGSNDTADNKIDDEYEEANTSLTHQKVEHLVCFFFKIIPETKHLEGIGFSTKIGGDFLVSGKVIPAGSFDNSGSDPATSPLIRDRYKLIFTAAKDPPDAISAEFDYKRALWGSPRWRLQNQANRRRANGRLPQPPPYSIRERLLLMNEKGLHATFGVFSRGMRGLVKSQHLSSAKSGIV